MSLVRDFEETLRYELELLRKVPLRKKGLLLGIPKAPVDFGLTSSKNTAITAEFDERAFLVTYDRQTLTNFFGTTFGQPGQGLTIRASSVKTTHDLINDINEAYDLQLRPEDVVSEPVSLVFATTKVTIKVTPACLWFTGSVDIPLRGSYEQLGDVLIIGFDSAPHVGKDTAAGVSKTLARAGQFCHHIDYGPATAALRAMTWDNSHTWVNAQPAQIQAMVNAMNNVDGFGWVYNTGSGVKNNLLNGNVAYNGPIEGFDLKIRHDVADPDSYLYAERFPLCRKDMSHVLVYQPNPTYGASNLSHYPMFVHYGEPVPKAHYEQADKPPVHWWKLQGDLENSGSSAGREPFPDVVSFFDDEWGKGAAVKAVGLFPLGFSWETNRDFTLSFKIARRDLLQEYQGLFCDSTGTAPIGAFVMGTNGRFYMAQQTERWASALASVSYRQRCEVTLCKRGQRYLVYVNGKCVNEADFTAVQVPVPWTHFGKVNHFLKTTTRFSDIKLFDYCLNRDQVSRHYRGLF